MSYAGIFGFTGLPDTTDENKEKFLDVLLDKKAPKDARLIAIMLALWSDLISIWRAEELLVEIGIMNKEELISAYKKLSDCL